MSFVVIPRGRGGDCVNKANQAKCFNGPVAILRQKATT